MGSGRMVSPFYVWQNGCCRRGVFGVRRSHAVGAAEERGERLVPTLPLLDIYNKQLQSLASHQQVHRFVSANSAIIPLTYLMHVLLRPELAQSITVIVILLDCQVSIVWKGFHHPWKKGIGRIF